MRLYALVEPGDPIDVYFCEADAQRALEDCLIDAPHSEGLLRFDDRIIGR